MKQPPRDRFRLHLPYCLTRIAHDEYVALNCEYQPVRHVPLLGSMTRKLAATLSANGSNDVETICLYHDGCIPTRSAANMHAYYMKLTLLDQVSTPRE